MVRVGTRSCDVQVELVAEALLSGERRLCTRGSFTLVAAKVPGGTPSLPPIAPERDDSDEGALRMMDVVFPPQIDHYGTLFGGDALSILGNVAFVASTRHARAVMVMAASHRIDFRAPIREGAMTELIARISMTGRSSVCVQVQLWAENLMTGDRRLSASAEFVMVSVDPGGRPQPIK